MSPSAGWGVDTATGLDLDALSSGDMDTRMELFGCAETCV